MTPSSQINVANIRPAHHQVGGHMSKEGLPESYVDDEGRFYKPYTEGPRAGREITLYNAIYSDPAPGQPRLHVAYPSLDGSAPADKPSQPPRAEDVEGLRPFLPKYWGTLEHDGQKLIALEDMCKPYRKPCIIDCKMGFTTVFDWAEEKYKVKNSPKDAEFTSSSCGFRISGLQVYRAAEDLMFKPERLWGRTLTKDNIGSAFELFASGGLLTPKQLYGHPTLGALAKLRPLEAWALAQRSFRMYQASVLLMYDGEAKSMEEANVRVSLVDFSYTFQSLGGADENLSSSITSLISILEKVVAAA